MTKQSHDGGWKDWVLGNSVQRMEAGTASFEPGPASPQPLNFTGAHTSPPFDVIEWLPDERKDLFRKICQHADDACALAVPFEDVHAASMDRVEKENELRRLTSHAQDGGFGLPETDSRVVLAQQALTKAKENFRRVQELQAERAEAQQAALRVKAGCEDFLRHGVPGGCKLEAAVEVEPPKLLKGETVLDGVERLRRDGRRIKADIHRVRSACYTKGEAMALVSATVENWGSNGIDTSVTIEHLSQPTIPTKTVQAMVHNVPGAPAAVVFVEVPDVAAILSTVLKDQFTAWLAADVDRNADPKGALSREAREQQETELMSDLLSTEQDICSLIRRGQAEGLPVEFPADISPLALLAVRLIAAPCADASPATTPGISWPMRR